MISDCMHVAYIRCLISSSVLNYARYLTFFATSMVIIEESHPGATESFIPGFRNAVDKTIEETIMKHAKSHRGAGGSGTGICGFLGNTEAYQRWMSTKHERAMFLEVTFSMADMLNESDSGGKHKNNRPSELQKSEKMVSITMNAINNFINPFDVDDKSRLYCISSGAPAPASIVHDVLTAEEIGKNAKELSIRERLEKERSYLNL